jgi:hypothetical protein
LLLTVHLCVHDGSLERVLDTVKLRQSTRPPAHARDLEDVVLQDDSGRDVRLGDLWAERPVALIFLRHYG